MPEKRFAAPISPLVEPELQSALSRERRYQAPFAAQPKLDDELRAIRCRSNPEIVDIFYRKATEIVESEGPGAALPADVQDNVLESDVVGGKVAKLRGEGVEAQAFVLRDDARYEAHDRCRYRGLPIHGRACLHPCRSQHRSIRNRWYSL